MKLKSRILPLLLAAAGTITLTAQVKIDYGATLDANISTGDFAPYLIGALNNGRTVRADNLHLDLGAKVNMDTTKRFSWGAGIEFITGLSSKNEYQRYNADNDTWTLNPDRPAAIWLQQLYGQVKYRGVFLRLGMKDSHSKLLDETISSGDLTRSSNARGIPGFEIGFIDFQDIPFTNGWVQIEGVVEYGKFMDNNFKDNQFNRYNYVLTKDSYYIYRRCYFRTKPTERFHVTLGMQAAGQFSGNYRRYRHGDITATHDYGFSIADMWDMFLPSMGSEDDGYIKGNSLGTWDFKADYRLRNGSRLSFAFQWPWEDGSAIGRRNGWDGLYGLYYHSDKQSIITGAAIEYIDFRNQSGPIHWASHDNPGTTINSEATGGDDYYNNEYYGSFSNYGVAIATPFLVAPVYNLNGFSGFAHNRARGFHLAIRGNITKDWTYALKYSYQQAWGRGRVPTTHCLLDNSMLAQADWNATSILKGLRFNAKLAFDTGSLRGDNFGVLIGIAYNGSLTFNKK